MVPGAAYKGILSVLITHLNTQCPPQHVLWIPGLGVGKGAGLTRVKKLDKSCGGGGGGGNHLGETWKQHLVYKIKIK